MYVPSASLNSPLLQPRLLLRSISGLRLSLDWISVTMLQSFLFSLASSHVINAQITSTITSTYYAPLSECCLYSSAYLYSSMVSLSTANTSSTLTTHATPPASSLNLSTQNGASESAQICITFCTEGGSLTARRHSVDLGNCHEYSKRLIAHQL